jgi:hypothetical protein
MANYALCNQEAEKGITELEIFVHKSVLTCHAPNHMV